MKLRKLKENKAINHRATIREDLRYLQKAISGRSVYSNPLTKYFRKPKHRKAEYQL